MAKKKQQPSEISLFEEDIADYLHTAVCVPAIKAAVESWKSANYPDITETTRELLNFWFHTDHLLANRQPFQYHLAQQEAIETLIYIYEVVTIRNQKELYEKYAFSAAEIPLPSYDDFARYCLKMATGSGKTLVISMIIVWQFANAIRSSETKFAKNFLLIAPNIIVLDRLRSDFANGRVFKTLPLLPKHFQWWWDMTYYMRGDAEGAYQEGAFYLTNIQQFYMREPKKDKKETDIMTDMLGNLPPVEKVEADDFEQRIAAREGLLMIFNDEAHHTHEEESEWNRFIRKLHIQKPLAAQIDVSATPRFNYTGRLFPWTIFDYPLKQAILDGVVKKPIKGISKIEEAASDIASVRYVGYLTAGVERWKEYQNTFKPLNKKPLLFVMMSNTAEADEVADWLQVKYPEHFAGGKTVVIHTNQQGEISSKDLELARKSVQEVDANTSPIHAVVSVLMLREGWDVQNVTVIVGLRSYSSKAQVLPEQTIGRGLRLMFRGQNVQETVDVIGSNGFMKIMDDLEKIEDTKFDSFEIGKDKLKILIVQTLAEKQVFDIAIPDISPLLMRKKSLIVEIEDIDVMKLAISTLPLKAKELEDTKSFIYEGRDILTDEKLFERNYDIPPAQTAEEIIGYYAKQIMANVKLASQFAYLAPKIRAFFTHKAFGKTVALNDREVILAMSGKVARIVTMREFERILREKMVEYPAPKLESLEKRLATTPAFPTHKKVLAQRKTIFNYTPCDNEFEASFAQFLDKAADIRSFAKLPMQFGFSVQYTDTMANIRNYFPDFVAITAENVHYLIETKGREDIEVRLKDEAAVNWCAVASELTAIEWKYIKVLQKDFEQLGAEDFAELVAVCSFDKGGKS